MNDNNKNIEKALLEGKEYDSVLYSKVESEFKKAITSKPVEHVVMTDIKDVPSERLFSKNSIYSVINKSSKTQSFINGIQAEGFLSDQDLTREKLLRGETDYFVSGDNFIKFSKYKV